MDIKQVELKIKLPETVSIIIPALSDIPLESVIQTLAKDGVALIQRTVHDRVMAEFVKLHEPYIQDEVERLVQEKAKEIGNLLTK